MNKNVILKCSLCNDDFEKNKYEYAKQYNKGQRNFFCSKSCSATNSNLKSPKRKKKKLFCKHCEVEIFGRKTVCEDCNANIVNWSKMTLGEARKNRTYQIHSRMRTIARKIYMKSDKPKYCVNCGYDKHFEVAHIMAINSFDDDVLVTVANDISNLLGLCRNCHWEFDNDKLSLEEIIHNYRKIFN